MLDAGRLDRRFRPREPTWTGRVCAAPIGGSPSARMPDGPRPRLGRGPSPGAGLHLLNGGACGNLRPCAPMPRAAARRTPHAARRTPHAARSTPHEARSTPRRACPGDVESVSSTRRASRFRWTANRRVAESRLRGAREPVGRSGDRTESKAKSAAEAAPGIGVAAEAVSAPEASPRRTPEPRAEAASLPVTAAESACRPARARRSRCFSGCPSRSGRCRSGRRACCASCRRRARRAAS
ncbi:Uncharacterised protein [Burkholderia pseudomallei]|nr:Uncharacterised protein [Burkholderia pseudomallei]CAJ3626018.1 Uncharacterised protein [Burkholderia pseudomallei]CAJ4591684.1 Uncharacterised protein [Burkholderia pseudomallei]CAJ5416397.1 Uncharacterised protein [Burkholderia pseudomallei]CAJ6216299.1 Uncharacterised protein [Burkholderia pseudomallei]